MWDDSTGEFLLPGPQFSQWDPEPSEGSARIEGVDLSITEQANIEDAANRMRTKRYVAAEMARKRAGYAGLFNSGNIV